MIRVGLQLAMLLAAAGLLSPKIVHSALIQSDSQTVFSGPQQGEKLPAFKVQVLESENQWQSRSWLEADETQPDTYQMVIFVHQVTRPSVAYVRALCQYAVQREADGLKTSLVFLTNDVAQQSAWIQRARGALPNNVRTGISPDGAEGPGAYGLNRNVTLTIVLGASGDVLFNQTLIDPNLPVELPKMLQAITSAMGGEVPNISALLPQRPQVRMENNPPNRPLPEGFDRVEPLLRKLIRKETAEAMVDDLANQIDALIIDKPEAKERLKEIATKVHAIYGTPRARYHLRRWAEIENVEESNRASS